MRLTKEQQRRAEEEHRKLKKLHDNVEKNILRREKAKEYRKLKKLKEEREIPIEKNIRELRYSNSKLNKQLEKSCKIMIITSKFIPKMSDMEAEEFAQQLERFSDLLLKTKKTCEYVRGLAK